MSDIVIFGLGQVAEVIYYYMTNESDFEVVAFTCDREFIDRDEILGLPVVPFEEALTIIVLFGYQALNTGK